MISHAQKTSIVGAAISMLCTIWMTSEAQRPICRPSRVETMPLVKMPVRPGSSASAWALWRRRVRADHDAAQPEQFVTHTQVQYHFHAA